MKMNSIYDEGEEMLADYNAELEMRKHRLQTLLRDNVMEVRFVKTNGDFRVMKCTLKPDIIPQPEKKSLSDLKDNMVVEEVKHKTVPENVLPVWDIEKNGWRSFRVANVYDFFVVRPE